MNAKIVTIAMIAIIAIGLTGLASAGSTTQTWTGDGSYTTTYGGVGNGDLTIYTHTTYGDDYISVDWQDASVAGTQTMTTSGFTKISRTSNVGTGVYGQGASGNIESSTTSADVGNGHYIHTKSTYTDDAAYGSNVKLIQNVKLMDNGPNEVLKGNARITGYAYGEVTGVSGLIEAGSLGVTVVQATVDVTQGSFDMSMKTRAKDNGASYLDRAKLKAMSVTATGTGTANLHADSDNVKVGIHTTNDGVWDHASGSQGTTFNQYDVFNTGYTASGYIYAFEV